MEFIDLRAQYSRYQGEIEARLQAVFRHGHYIMGPEIAELEAQLAAYVGVRHALTVASGTDSLEIALRALGIGAGDEVITVPFTWISTAEAIALVGAAPVFVDIEPATFNLDVGQLEAAITPRCRAILPVSLFGQMPDYDRINAIAARHNLAVIEDACQSLGSSINGKGAGSWGVTGCWSFYPFKILGAYGDGGAITTDDENVATFARRMRYNGEDRETGEYHGHGFTCLLDNLQAAFLDVKIKHLPAWIARRREIAHRYRQGLNDLPGLTLPHYDRPGFDHVYQNYTVRSTHGDAFSQYLQANGIEVLTQFRKPYYRHEALELGDRKFPETEAISREVCSLPIYPELEEQEIDYVISVVRRFYVRD